MITVRMGRFEKASLNSTGATRAATMLADQLAASATNNLKIALIQRGKVATGDTLRSIRWRNGMSSFGVLDTHQRREIIGDASLGNIIAGRRAGAKMPIQVVGRGKRGGKVFAPVERMVRWFEAMGVPKDQWFPIMRRFSMRGIMPRRVDHDAIKLTRRSLRMYMNGIKPELLKGLIIKG